MSKIVVVLKGYPRSDEIFIAQELVELERHGFELTIYSLVKPEDKVRQQVDQLLKAQVIYVPKLARDLIFSFLIALCRRPIAVLELWGRYRAGATVSGRTLRRFLQSLWIYERTGSQMDILYSHFVNAPSEVAMGLEFLSGAPWFVFAHAKDIHQTPRSVLEQRLEQARTVFACNRESQQLLSKIFPRVKLVYHGVNQKLLKAREERVSSEELYLYSAGRLVEKKGHDFLLLVLAELKKMGVAFHFHLFGDGPMREALERMSSALGLRESIVFHGAYTLDQLSAAVKPGSLYLGAFRQARDLDRDGLPNTLLEAMYLGAIALCSDSLAIGEVLRHGENGFILGGNPSEWAQKIVEISRLSEAQRLELIKTAQSEVRKNFDFAHCCQQLISEFKSIEQNHDRGTLCTITEL